MKRYITILILIALFSTSLIGASALAFASTVTIDNSYVLDDLQGSLVNGTTFDADNYGYTDEKEPTILSFAEYGFSWDTSSIGDYALYVYIYNPSGRPIRDTELNKIGIATVYSNGEIIDSEKFELQLLSFSTGKYAYLFYKFKVIDIDSIWLRVSATTNKRRYDVSEIELNYGLSSSEAYDVGNYYEYSGFAKGYGANSSSESTLSCNSDKIQTLRLDLHTASYVYNNGETIKSNLHSAYFGVSEDIFAEFGVLQQIKANWYLTFTAMQYFVYNKSYYNFLAPYVGYLGSRIPLRSFTDETGKTPTSIGGFIDGSWAGLTYLPGSNGSEEFPWWYDYGYNYDGMEHATDTLRWLFPLDSESNYTVSSKEVADYAQEYTEKFVNILSDSERHGVDDLLLDKYIRQLFVDTSKLSPNYKYTSNGVTYSLQIGWQGDNGKGVVIDADDKFTINGFVDTDSKLSRWWKNLFRDYDGFDTTDLENISPIYIVKDSDVQGSDAVVASKLLINDYEVDDFKSVYYKNEKQGKKTVIFRYLVSPYYVTDLTAEFSTFSGRRIGYAVQQAVPLDFDVIWLKFVDFDKETVIPVVASPVDAFTGYRPFEDLDGNGWNWLAVALGILLLVFMVLAVVKLLETIKKKR